MRLYVEGIFFGNLPRRKGRKRLVGLNIVRQAQVIDVEPIYRAPLQIARYGSYLVIEAGRDRPRHIFVLQLRWPLVQYYRVDEEHLMEET